LARAHRDRSLVARLELLAELDASSKRHEPGEKDGRVDGTRHPRNGPGKPRCCRRERADSDLKAPGRHPPRLLSRERADKRFLHP
jgi:hypothetical protein